MGKIDIHADDYALTINTSKDMLRCMEAGCLDSISIVPNMSCYDDCMKLLLESIPKLPFLPLMSVHIDLVEGKMLSKEGTIIPEAGYTWGSLFKASYNPFMRTRIKHIIKEEIREQIKKVMEDIDKCIVVAESNNIPRKAQNVRIDSHQHAHMIPLVWESIVEVLDEEKLKLDYIRNSKEPLAVFLKDSRYRTSYRLINIVKNRLLAVYSGRVDRFLDKNGLDRMFMWGLIMSGKMDRERVKSLLPAVKDISDKKNYSLEILFHPGTMLKEEISKEIPKESTESFYMSDGRSIEMDAVINLKKALIK